jgi:hypothetical protein
MCNSSVAIGIAVIEHALRELPDFKIQQLELAPPDRIRADVTVVRSILGHSLTVISDNRCENISTNLC